MRTRSRAAARRVGDDAGFGLLETVVAMLVLSVVSLAVLSMLTTAQRTAYGNRARVVAANLAASEMDQIRTEARDGINAIGIGVPRSGAHDVAGTTYTVSTEIEYVDTADPGTTCGVPVGVQLLDAVRVNVEVTWPTMGGVQPVTSDTVISPSFADLNSESGTIVVRVVDRDGLPLQGATASVPTGSAVTTAEGCAILLNVPNGTTELRISKLGHVSTAGAELVTDTVTVVGGSATNVEAMLDEAATLELTGPASAADFPVPRTADGFKLRLSNAEVPGGGYLLDREGALDASTTTDIGNLFPFSGGYDVYAGPCELLGPSGAVRTAVTEPGQTADVAVPFRQVELRADWGSPMDVAGYVEFVSEEVDTCPSISYFRGSEAEPVVSGYLSQAEVRASLPTGTYTVVAHYRVNGGLWSSYTLGGTVAVDAGVETVQVIEATS